MLGREYADVLRQAASFFESHPQFPVPDTYRTVALLYEYPGRDADFVLQVAQREGFMPDITKTGGTVIWLKDIGAATLGFVLPSETRVNES